MFLVLWHNQRHIQFYVLKKRIPPSRVMRRSAPGSGTVLATDKLRRDSPPGTHSGSQDTTRRTMAGSRKRSFRGYRRTGTGDNWRDAK